MSKLLIAGGGIGGLASALACSQGGMEVALYERAAEFTEVGAGIQLGPNATQVLLGWGLAQALDEVVARPDRLQVRSAISGRELGVLPLGERALQRYGAPYVTVHRADLHALLLAELMRRDQVRLHLKSTVSRFEQGADGITVQLQDGRRVTGDALLGADGGFSGVRQQLLNDGTPQPTGHLAYRAMVLQSSLPQALRSQQVTAWLGPKLHVVQYPVRRGEWLNVVAIVHGQVQGDLAQWDHRANGPELQRLMGITCNPLQSLIAAIGEWRLWGLSIRPPLAGAHHMAQGRVALLGDAAHPMLPYLAQGAGMALEDAHTLAQVLTAPAGAQGADVASRLTRYAQQRYQRNARVQARAIRNGQIFHAQGPLRWGRDAAMALLGEKLLDVPWLYQGSSSLSK